MGERPWDGEGEAGKVVLAWERVTVQVEEGGVGAGEMWDTEVGSGDHGMMVSGEGGRSEGDGMEMPGCQGVGETAGHGPVAQVAGTEVIKETILEVINLFYVIFTTCQG